MSIIYKHNAAMIAKQKAEREDAADVRKTRRVCDACSLWRRFSGRHGYCTGHLVEQGARIGWLVTRKDDHCGKHEQREKEVCCGG